MTRADAVALVHGLVAIPSLSRQEAAASAWLARWMETAGYDRAYVDEAGNAVGELGAPDAPRVIVLLGHIDTVPGDIPVRIEKTRQKAEGSRQNDETDAGAEAPALRTSDDAALGTSVARTDAAHTEPRRTERRGFSPGEDTGGILHGRGSVDAKGPLATFAAAGARLGSQWAHDAGVRLVVVGAVEEEAATSKGARFVAGRFDGRGQPIPLACVIGEPSSWRRVTLGYKGRLLLDIAARQAMAHTAGPDAAVAEVVVDLWNWARERAAAANAASEKPFEQLTPSLRRFITANEAGLTDTVDAQIAWRLPVGFDADVFVNALLAWTAPHVGAPPIGPVHLQPGDRSLAPLTLNGPRTQLTLSFRGWEPAWRSDRQNALVRSFLSGIRQIDAAAQPGFVVKTGTSDMNVVGPVWQCPIVAYGPGDSAFDHTPHEHLELDEYWRAVQVLEATLRQLAFSLG